MRPLPGMSLLLLLALCACATHRSFAPREGANAVSPSGLPAASYQLGEGPLRGELRVWSDGAEIEDENGPERAVLQIGFELENLGATPLRLETDAVRVQDLRSGSFTVDSLSPSGVSGMAEAQPGRTVRVAIRFEAAGLRPREIDGFEVRWRVRTEEGGTFEQATPFLPWVVPAWYGDDYWCGYGYGWSWGWGVGVGWHHASW